MKTAVMIPVKRFTQAKSRLSTLLSAEERAPLAAILLEGVLEAVGGLPGTLHKVVVTDHPPAIGLAERFGFRVMREDKQLSESHSVDRASAALEAEGIGAVLRVPLDLPLVSGEELREILARAEAGLQGVLVPSRDGTGTNAVYRSPPTLFPSRFGPDSLSLHKRSLEALEAPHAVLILPGLGLDLDDAGDVEELLRRGQDCPARDYLMGLGVEGRLAAIRRAGA